MEIWWKSFSAQGLSMFIPSPDDMKRKETDTPDEEKRPQK